MDNVGEIARIDDDGSAALVGAAETSLPKTALAEGLAPGDEVAIPQVREADLVVGWLHRRSVVRAVEDTKLKSQDGLEIALPSLVRMKVHGTTDRIVSPATLSSLIADGSKLIVSYRRSRGDDGEWVSTAQWIEPA